MVAISSALRTCSHSVGAAISAPVQTAGPVTGVVRMMLMVGLSGIS